MNYNTPAQPALNDADRRPLQVAPPNRAGNLPLNLPNRAGNLPHNLPNRAGNLPPNLLNLADAAVDLRDINVQGAQPGPPGPAARPPADNGRFDIQ
jgi:hypothetical protein